MVDESKLNEILDNPGTDHQELQEVFAFVEDITGQKISPNELTSEDVETWNERFDKVLRQLF